MQTRCTEKYFVRKKKNKLFTLLSYCCNSNASQTPKLYLEQLEETPEPSPASCAWGNWEASAVVAALLFLRAPQAGEADGNVIYAPPHTKVSTGAA